MKKTDKNIIVNLVDVETCDDVQLEFIKAKALAGEQLAEWEFKFIVAYGARLAFDTIDACINKFLKDSEYLSIENDKLAKDLIKMIEKATKPKKPWYKRLWAWITRKK